MAAKKTTKKAAGTEAGVQTSPAGAVDAMLGVQGVQGGATKSEEKGSGTGKKAAAAPKEVTWQDIERRAYFIFADRGFAHGDPAADWYEAERQLRAGL